MEGKRLSGIVLETLDERPSTGDLARQAFQSRTGFHRLFRAVIEETPDAMRRRLLLERAAWMLSRTRHSVTEIALGANYGSLEAFTRAFRKAYARSPSIYRRIGTWHFHLPSSNGIHFAAPGARPKGVLEMDLFDRFAGNDSWHTQKLLAEAAKLTDEQLDRPLPRVAEILPWREATKSIRELLENIVFTKEVWTAAITGQSMDVTPTPPERRSPAILAERLKKADAELHRVLREVGDRSGWDDTFVDALCEPAETFTYGGVFAHIMTFNAYRRIMVLDAMRSMGVDVQGYGDPMEYEESVK